MIVDAGPLVAFVNARDAFHAWTVEQFKRYRGPMLTCEAAISESLYVLRNVPGGPDKIVGLLRTGGVRCAFGLDAEVTAVCKLLTKYADVPMSLADACLVRMSELLPKHDVVTLDDDFHVYRRHRNQKIPVVRPGA
jgi:predicted nucleic acid-binding protein